MRNYKGKNNPNYKNGKYDRTKGRKCICVKDLFYPIAETCPNCRPVTRETKEKMRKNHADVSGKNNPMYGKTTHSKYIKYKNKLFHSTWEVAFAKFLDKEETKWKYESTRFNLGKTTYTPDFYLPNLNLYIEIKGYWREDAEEKFKLFKKLYPHIRIKILYEKDLKSMEIL